MVCLDRAGLIGLDLCSLTSFLCLLSQVGLPCATFFFVLFEFTLEFRERSITPNHTHLIIYSA